MNRVLKARLRHKVLVTCKSGDAFSGVFFEADREAVVLRSAQQADPRGDKQWVTADGEIVILVAEIAFMQFIT